MTSTSPEHPQEGPPRAFAPSPPARMSAGAILVLLTLANVLNFYDRAIPAIIVEPIKAEFGLTDGHVGVISSSFTVVYAVAGILLVWQNAQISPGTAGLPAVIDILVIAIVGGLGRPIGPFVGALIYVVLQVFAPDILRAVGLSGDRFKLLIGLGFLAVVYWSPDGVLGLWERWRARRGRDPLTGEVE